MVSAIASVMFFSVARPCACADDDSAAAMASVAARLSDFSMMVPPFCIVSIKDCDSVGYSRSQGGCTVLPRNPENRYHVTSSSRFVRTIRIQLVSQQTQGGRFDASAP